MSSEKEQTFIRRMFESYDTNNNGTLERDEFCNVLKTLIKELAEGQSEDEFEAIAEEAIQKFDFNRNGIIEKEEFEQFVKFLIIKEQQRVKHSIKAPSHTKLRSQTYKYKAFVPNNNKITTIGVRRIKNVIKKPTNIDINTLVLDIECDNTTSIS